MTIGPFDPDRVGCRTPMCDRPAVLYAAGPTLGDSPRLTFIAGVRAGVLETADVTAGSAVCVDCAVHLLERLGVEERSGG
jgi:hypothetical protein